MVKAVKLYVGNLPDGTKSGELQSTFEKYGKVEECDVLRNYAFVHISDEDEAKVAVECLNNTEFNGSRITVEISHNKGQCYRCGRQGHIPKECPLNAKTLRANPSVPKEIWWCNAEVQDAVEEKRVARQKWEETQSDEDRKIYVEKKREAKRIVAQAKTRANKTIREKKKDGSRNYNQPSLRNNATKDDQATKLYVGKLAEDVSSDNLRTLFEKYGDVEECDVLKNYGFVHMKTVDEAKTAVEALNQTDFMGSKITVEVSKSKGQCYACGRQGHWSKECTAGMGGRSGLGSSLMSRFGSRQLDRSYAMDRLYRDRMRPYPDMYERRALALSRPSDDYYRSYSDYYSYSRPYSGGTYDRDFDYSGYRRPQNSNMSSM